MAVTASPRTTWLLPLAGLAVIGAYVLLVEGVAHQQGYDLWGAMVFVPLLVVVSVHLIARVSDGDRWLFTVLLVAFLLKALSTVARYAMAFVLYDGVADANGYHNHGERLAVSYREGDFDADIGRDLVGTGFIRALTGVLYAVTGPSIYVAYAFFACLGFWGLYFLYRAFRTGVPGGNHRRYAALVLFLPSMLFWPSGLGKDAWMTLGIGLVALGAARLLTDTPGWLIPLATGLTATALVRPHITAALFVGVAVAYVVRRSHRPGNVTAPITRAATLAAVLVVGLLLVGRAAEFLGVEEVTASGFDAAVEGTQDRTAQGGSEFEAQPVNSPLDLPWATVSVLFRPFVLEADGAAMMMVAAEGMLLLFLLFRSLPRFQGALGKLRTQPYLVFCIVYTLLFVYAFSNFSNFGILTRQRVQVLPFVLVCMALPLVATRRADRSTFSTTGGTLR
jgi:hypothetical protein